jgi:transmembrane sensor
VSDPAEARSESVAEIEAQAAAWIRRRHFWDWTAAEQSALDAWLDEAISHRVAYWRMEAGFARTEKLVALRAPAAEAPARRFPFLIGIAAAFVIAAVIGVAAMKAVQPPQDRLYTTRIGGHETIAFADGSKIELNTDTVLRTRMTTDQRMVWLDKGEAYFQVRHDAAHPFIVNIGNRRVTDLGTAFLVRRDEARMEVAVMQGRVRLDAAGYARQTAMLTPGDVVTAAGETMSRAKKTTNELINELGWRRGVLVFDNMTLANAVEEFNRYNTQKIIVTDPAAARLAMVGTFPIHDVAAFTDAVQDVFKLRVENRKSEIVISR